MRSVSKFIDPIDFIEYLVDSKYDRQILTIMIVKSSIKPILVFLKLDIS